VALEQLAENLVLAVESQPHGPSIVRPLAALAECARSPHTVGRLEPAKS
jgi:hypothetical protein